MKPRISCFGHGWALETPRVTYYVGSFQECIGLLDSVRVSMIAQALHDSCVMNRLGLQETGRA